MVLKGQFLERPTLIRVGKSTLEGLWHRGELAPAALLLSPLPGQGSMDHAALNEIAFAASRAGHATLRFNYSGIGASPKRPQARLEVEARAALRDLRQSAGTTRAIAVALRSGCEVGVELLEDLEALILISPPADLDLGRLAASPCPVAFVLGADDAQRARLGSHCGTTGDRLEVIENADLEFNRGLPQLGRTVVAALQELAGVSPDVR